jgi:hypothetical protein
MFFKEPSHSDMGNPKQKNARTGWWKQGFPQRELILDQQRLKMARTEGQYQRTETPTTDVSIVEAGVADAARTLEGGHRI